MAEKLKNTLRMRYTAAVFGILAVPATALAIREAHSGDATAETETVNAENRVLAQKPSLRNEDQTLNVNYPAEFDAWFSDSFGFRSQLVTAYSTLTGSVFRVSSEKAVIIGKGL